MAYKKSTGESGVGGGDQTLTLRPSTTKEEVLAALKRQGISDLESLTTAALAKVREATEEDDAPGESVDFFISEHYVLFRDTTPQ